MTAFEELLSKEWNGKKIWEWIRNAEEKDCLTSALAFKGRQYDNARIKIMYVGHAVNGWDILNVKKCKTMSEIASAVREQENGLDTVIRKDTYSYIDKKGRVKYYNHINSKFFRLIKQILEFQGESDEPTDDTWYNDSKNWNEKIVWSNLYCIAPRKGGNPSDKFIKPLMKYFVQLFKIQIEKYEPDIVIVCPLKGYFTPWIKEPSFKDVLDTYDANCNIGDVIIGKGTIGKTQLIVCRRPDALGKNAKTRSEVREMAKVISEYIDNNCK